MSMRSSQKLLRCIAQTQSCSRHARCYNTSRGTSTGNRCVRHQQRSCASNLSLKKTSSSYQPLHMSSSQNSSPPNNSSPNTDDISQTTTNQNNKPTRHATFRRQTVMNGQRPDNHQSSRHINGHKSKPLYIQNDAIQDDIYKTAKEKQTGVCLKELLEKGKNMTDEYLLENTRFLWHELPVRLAKRVVELQSLPYGLSDRPAIQEVANLYKSTFATIRFFPEPRTFDDVEPFVNTIAEIFDKHQNVVPQVAKGLIEMNEKWNRPHDEINGYPSERNGGDEIEKFNLEECPYLTDFLNRFYIARIGIRFLIGHHIELFRDRANKNSSFVGSIDGGCKPRYIAEDAVNDASSVCQQTLGDYPEVIVEDSKDVTCTYVPTHLHYMLFELLKNSMRAVVEHHHRNHGPDSYNFPPIHVVITEGDDDIAIRISDQGGGIGRRDISRILSYTYTTAHKPVKATEVGGLINAPMAGFGYGLPISTLYANYFGGELAIHSMDGFGTDAYLRLSKLGGYSETLT